MNSRNTATLKKLLTITCVVVFSLLLILFNAPLSSSAPLTEEVVDAYKTEQVIINNALPTVSTPYFFSQNDVIVSGYEAFIAKAGVLIIDRAQAGSISSVIRSRFDHFICINAP